MKVLFNADDFGLTKGVTDAIMKSHLHGVVTATTLMMNGFATKYAVEQAKSVPSLKVGIHLVLTYGRPLRNDVPDLIDSSGHFKYRNTFAQMETPNLDQVELEWTTQIEAFLQTGLTLDHIDSHHHVHGWEPLKEIVIRLAKKYNVPIRYVDTLSEHQEFLLTEYLWTDFYGNGLSMNIFEEIKNLSLNSIEIMCHPGYVDDDLKSVSSYTEAREKELKILCELELPDWVELYK